jgi:GNAT superfamily N-acetyltransferase
MIDTRIATAGDVEALAELITAFNVPYPGVPVSAAQAASRLAATQGIETTILAEVDGQAAGFACLRLVPYMSGDDLYAELTDLFVAEAFRRRGVASALMAHVERLALGAGASGILLLTGFDNPGAQAFYRAVGYADFALAMNKSL